MDIELFERTEDAKVTWFPHSSGMDVGVRPVPEPEKRRMFLKYGGKKRTVTRTDKGPSSDVDMTKAPDWDIERACLALFDTRPGADPNAAFNVAGDALAAKFATALGEEVKSGDRVKLHGKWTMPVKELVLGLAGGLRDFVLEKCGELEGDEAEGEEGKG